MINVIHYVKHALIFILLVGLSIQAQAGEALTLEAFLNSVSSENLDLKVNAAEKDAAQANAVGLAVPPPMVGITQMKDQSGSANNFEVSQTIPFPTKLSADHSARKFEAKAKETNLLVAKKDVLAQARLLYTKLWSSQERIDLLKEKKSAINQHLKLSRASARSDSFLRIHVLKAESDLDLLENEILESEQLLREKQIQMAEFSHQDPNTFKPVVTEPPLTTLPSEGALSTPLELEAKRFDLEKFKALESEAHASWFPELNLRYREMGGTQMNPKYSEVMLGATLPFAFFWEPNAASKSATAERMKAETEFSRERLRFDSRKTTLLSRAESLKKQLEQIQSKLLPRAERRMHLVHNLAPRDMESLQDHREAMEAFPDLKLKLLDLRIQYEEAVAELQSFTSGAE